MKLNDSMEGIVDTTRGPIAIKRSGPRGGPCVVFVAGLGDDLTSWSPVVDDLRNDYDCVTFDNRGIGSSGPAGLPNSITEMADDVEALAMALGLDDVWAVGHSMGGAICQSWYLAYPERITGLVLSSTWAATDPWLDLLLGTLEGLAEQRLGHHLLEQFALFAFSQDFFAANPATIDEILSTVLPDLEQFAGAAQACRHHDVQSRLAQIRVPTLVITAQRDILIRRALSQPLLQHIPGAVHAVVDAGHMSVLEQPGEWSTACRAFIEGNAGLD